MAEPRPPALICPGGFRFRFADELGPGPKLPDVIEARRHHIKIMELLDRDDTLPKGHPDKWTRSERNWLTLQYRRWFRRAMGLDQRWALVGSKAGRIRRDLEIAINPRAERESLAWRRALDGGMPTNLGRPKRGR